MRITHLYHEIIFTILRSRIKRNPYLGQEAGDGGYLYKKGGYGISYRILKLPAGKIRIEWLSHKRRLSAYEEKLRKTKQRLIDFWHYQKWLILLRPSILFLLIVGMFLFYSEVMETQETKMARLKWMIASAVGIATQDIQYIGDGWLEISGQRRRTVEKINEPTQYVYEPIKYTFNPLKWFFSSDTGFVKRWRSESGGGYATHPVVYNDKGDIWLKKQDSWEHGRVSGETIKWDTPQVTGMSIRKTSEHEISVQDKKLKVIDK